MNSDSLGTIADFVLWAIVLANVALTLALARLVGRIGRRIPPGGARVIDPGPEVGEVLEGWETTDLLGRSLEVRFPRERGLLLVYVSPHCSTCTALLPPAKSFMREVRKEVESAWVMVLGSEASQIEYAQANDLDEVAVLREDHLPAGFRLEGAPFAVWLDGNGKVCAKGMVNTREHLESLRNAARLGHPSMDSYIREIAEQRERARAPQGV